MSQDPAHSRKPGGGPRQLGKYELLRHLATGGMAEIFLARAKRIEGFEKLVVVKRLLPEAERNPTLVAMFLDEARVAATLHHPNVVQVYDIGVTPEDNYFFTMEFVYGQDLSHLLRRAAVARRRPSLDQALTIIIGLCSGLHYAHEKEGADGKPLRLVHRDVSPQNVLISYDGAVKIMDFGIAKATSNSEITSDGILKGKVAYMSPEQAMSKTVDRRSDVFSLAIMLWELTCFRRLYKADSDFETLRKIIEEDAPLPSQYEPHYPLALEKIVMKGLARNAAERYATCEELQLDLEAFARERRLVVSTVSTSRYVRELFGDRVSAWAKAQADGKNFADFLVEAPAVEEGTAVTADTWSAPSTDTDAAPEHIFGPPDVAGRPLDSDDRDDAPEISVAGPAPRRRRVLWPVLAGAAVGVCAFAVWFLLRTPKQAPPSLHPTAALKATPPVAPLTTATTSTNPATAPSHPVMEPSTAPAPSVVETDKAVQPSIASGKPDKPASPASKGGKSVTTRPPAKPPGGATTPPTGETKPKVKEDLDSPFPN